MEAHRESGLAAKEVKKKNLRKKVNVAYTVCRVAESDSCTKQTLWHCLCVYASPSVRSHTRETKVTC